MGCNVFFLKKYSDYTSFDSSGIQNGKSDLYILDRVIGYEEQIVKERIEGDANEKAVLDLS